MTLDELRASACATVTVKDAAAIVGVDPRTLTAELSVNGGTIPARRIGRRVVIPREAFLTWLNGDDTSLAPAAEAERRDANVTDVVRVKLLELLGALEVGA